MTSPDSPNRESLVERARQRVFRGPRGVATASRLFDRQARERVWLLYGWVRRSDEIIDDWQNGTPQSRLDTVRRLTNEAIAGTATGEDAFDGFGVLARECAIDRALIDQAIAGFALDAAEWSPRSEADMLEYCYLVSGSVAVMQAELLGVARGNDDLLDRACELGMAFELSQIARDLSRDDADERCYLPMEWLAEADIPPGEQMRPAYRERLLPLVARLSDLAAQYEASARSGLSDLPFRRRWALLASAGLYGEVVRKVDEGGVRAWDHRIETSRGERMASVARAFVDALRNEDFKAPEPPLTRTELAARAAARAMPEAVAD